MDRSAPTSFIILDAQSVKNTETTENKSYDGYTGGSFVRLVQSTIGTEMIIVKQSDLKYG